MYSAKNPSCNKPNLIIPIPALTRFNYLWVGTIQIVNISFLIKCVVVVICIYVGPHEKVGNISTDLNLFLGQET